MWFEGMGAGQLRMSPGGNESGGGEGRGLGNGNVEDVTLLLGVAWGR